MNFFKIAVLIVTFCLTSCYGYYTSTNFVDLRKEENKLDKFDEEACIKQNNDVQLLFEGETVKFEYDRIGLLEVKGNSSSTDADVLKELKKEAKKKCCNAVIGVKKSYVDRSGGLLFITEEKDEIKYEAVTYTGVAVIIKS